MACSTELWRYGIASLCATLSAACTLSFELPEASDAGVADAAPEPDAAPGFTACSSAYDPVSVNTLEAGDFEIDREGWSNSGDYTHDLSESLLGNASLRAVQDSVNTILSVKDYPVSGSTLYTISGWIKTSGATEQGCRMRVRWKIADGTYPSSASSAYVTGTSDWTLVQATGTSRSGAVEGRIQLECSDGAGEAWFDNLWFLPGNGPICGNLSCELEENCLSDCGPGGAASTLLVEGFDRAPMTERWNTAATGTWAIMNSGAAQSLVGSSGYTSPVNTLAASDYRVGAQMRRTSTEAEGKMGLSLRGSTAATGYQCTWDPAAATLAIVGEQTLASATFPEVLGDASYSPDATFAMQAEAVGDQIQCCVHGVPGAALTVSDSAFGSGEPGLTTGRMSAVFDSVMVVSP